MLLVGRRAFPWVLWQVTKTGSRELFTLAVVVAAVTIAYGSVAAVRRVVRPRRLLRRHGAARVELQPSRRRGSAAAARCLRGAVLRLGRHALRSRGAVRASRCRCWRSWRSSSSASRWRRRRSCWRSAIRCAPPSRSRRAWRRSASSRSSSAPWAFRSACCRRKDSSLVVAGALISIALNPLCCSLHRADRPLARQPSLLGRRGAITRPTRSPSCRCRPTRSTCRSRSCSSATAGSASASPPS